MAMGNDQARKVYLARLPRGYAEPTPDSDAERRGAFIRAKYARLKWANAELREARKADITQRRAASAAAAARRSSASPARSGQPMPSLSSEGA